MVPVSPVTWCWMPGPFMATGYRRPGAVTVGERTGGGGEMGHPSGTLLECLLNVAH